MHRIVFAWELGANFGHLARGLPIALRVRARGYETLFAVRDVEVAHSMLSPSAVPFVAAPRPLRAIPLRRAPINYGQILAEAGYAHRPTLRANLAAWINLWRLTTPSAVVIDHSPTALLAARVLGIPAMLLGTGFTIPPDADPLPPLRSWEKVSIDELRRSDAFVLDNINAAVTSFDHPPLARIADLFTGLPSLLATFAELDHYDTRPNATFIGPVGAQSHYAAAEWASGEGPRVFAYLRMGIAGLDVLLSVLKESEANVVCIIPSAPESLIARLTGPRFRLYPHPIDLSSVLKAASAVVTYGGAGLTAEALIAGAPLLLVPQNAEQHLGARRVASLGAGMVIDWQRSKADITRALIRLLTEPGYKQAAAALAHKFSSFDSQTACDSTADAIVAITENVFQSGDNAGRPGKPSVSDRI